MISHGSSLIHKMFNELFLKNCATVRWIWNTPTFNLSNKYRSNRANEHRWPDEGGGDRNERTTESGQDTAGRKLRHREARPRRAHVQIHGQQTSAKCFPALQPAESYDQGKRAVFNRANHRYTGAVSSRLLQRFIEIFTAIPSAPSRSRAQQWNSIKKSRLVPSSVSWTTRDRNQHSSNNTFSIITAHITETFFFPTRTKPQNLKGMHGQCGTRNKKFRNNSVNSRGR